MFVVVLPEIHPPMGRSGAAAVAYTRPNVHPAGHRRRGAGATGPEVEFEVHVGLKHPNALTTRAWARGRGRGFLITHMVPMALHDGSGSILSIIN